MILLYVQTSFFRFYCKTCHFLTRRSIMGRHWIILMKKRMDYTNLLIHPSQINNILVSSMAFLYAALHCSIKFNIFSYSDCVIHSILTKKNAKIASILSLLCHFHLFKFHKYIHILVIFQMVFVMVIERTSDFWRLVTYITS